jgi:pyruvate/2-oxoglutarate dehydrogenase complex dihydrolipoamide acyltransferase (E2) component
VPVRLPQLGDPRAVLSAWYIRDGDRVCMGDRIAEVMIPGVTFDIPAPTTGQFRERSALPGDVLTLDHILGWIEEDSA